MLRFSLDITQDITIQNLRIALLNHIKSKQLNQEFLIQIEDINKQENIEGKDKEILNLLNLFNIDYTKVVYQSENIKYHTQMAMKLLLDKKAFNCFCSDEALKLDKEKAKKLNIPYSYSGFCETISDETKFNCNAPFVVRLKKPKHNITFTDLLEGELNYQPSDVDSIVILGQDKTPMYDFASAVDDMLYDVSIVIKNTSDLLSTSKQIHIRESLGYSKKIQYIHLSNIQTNNSLDSLDSLSVQWFINEGYLPIAIANYLILLGYNDAPLEIFTLEEAIQWFDITKVSKEVVTFEISKLNFLNNKYIKMMDELRLSKILGYADKDIGILAKIYLEECDTIKQIKTKIDMIFSKKEALQHFENEFNMIKDCLKHSNYIDNFDNLISYISEQTKLKDEKLFTVLRYLLTGTTNGPDLDTLYPLIKNYLGEITT